MPRALADLAALLGELGIRWALIGALAANRYRASARTTQDVDLLLANTGPGLEAALQRRGWELRRATPDADLLRLRHAEFGIADLLIAGTDYQQEALRRAHSERIGDGPALWVLSVEDVILHKLIAGRRQDHADVEAILAAGVALDERYLERWIGYWDLRGDWECLREG